VRLAAEKVMSNSDLILAVRQEGQFTYVQLDAALDDATLVFLWHNFHSC